MVEITRHFATIQDGRWGTRQVHYRRAGSGPLVVLFHQSPLSSRDMIATMQRWAKRFTCIAPDSPGYGLSDPLGVPRAEMDDYADAAVELFDALGIAKAAVYGFHTGAMVAGVLAQRHPDRIVAAASNGYVISREAERADILAHYLPEFAPQWDGSHLAWLWARLREQTIFFPWYSKRLEDRLSFDVPSPQALHASCLDVLRSGDHHRVGYRAAFTLRSDLTLREAKAPLLITAADTDVLVSSLARIRHASPKVAAKRGGTADATLDLCAAWLARHKPPRAPKLQPAAPIAGRLASDMVAVDGGQLRVRRNGDVQGRTVLVLHDAGGSAESASAVAESFIGIRPVLVVELPGHGESSAASGNGPVSFDAYALSVLQALDVLGIGSVDVVGLRAGGLVGLELAALAPGLVAHIAMIDAPAYDPSLREEMRQQLAPVIEPVWHGGHLLHAWHLVRDQQLFFPGHRRTRDAIVRRRTELDPAFVNRRVTDLLKNPQRWREAHLAEIDYPLTERLAATRATVFAAAAETSPLFDIAQRAGRRHRRHRRLASAAEKFERLPAAVAQWGEALAARFTGDGAPTHVPRGKSRR